jgi:hypothetical protein
VLDPSRVGGIPRQSQRPQTRGLFPYCDPLGVVFRHCFGAFDLLYLLSLEGRLGTSAYLLRRWFHELPFFAWLVAAPFLAASGQRQ